MPVMHRVSCFRDDVVFLIYLYQRRIYSVDMSRGSRARTRRSKFARTFSVVCSVIELVITH